ncbi:MAG: DMT family transporter [Bacillota bacterium]
MRSFTRGEWWALVAALSYLGQGLTMRAAAVQVDAVFCAMVTAIPAVIFAFVAVMCSPSRREQFSAGSPSFVGCRNLVMLAGAAVLSYAVGNTLWVLAFRFGGVTLTSPATQSTAIWGALLGLLILKEHLNRSTLWGLAIFAVGLIMLGAGRSLVSSPGEGWAWAVVFGVTAALCWTVLGVASRFVMLGGVDRFSVLFFTAAVGQLSLHTALAFRGYPGLDVLWSADLVYLALAGIFNLSAQISLTTALSLTEVARVNIITAGGSALAPILGFVIFRDPLNMVMVGAIACVLTGAVTVQRSTSRQLPKTLSPR